MRRDEGRVQKWGVRQQEWEERIGIARRGNREDEVGTRNEGKLLELCVRPSPYIQAKTVMGYTSKPRLCADSVGWLTRADHLSLRRQSLIFKTTHLSPAS